MTMEASRIQGKLMYWLLFTVRHTKKNRSESQILEERRWGDSLTNS